MQRYSAFSLFRHALTYHENWQKVWRNPEPKKHYDVITIGGGGHGLATAYYLAKNHGVKHIAVIEKGYLGGGNTGRNTTIVRSNYLWDEAAQLYEHALRVLPRASMHVRRVERLHPTNSLTGQWLYYDPYCRRRDNPFQSLQYA